MKIKRILFAVLTALALGVVSLGEASAIAGALPGGVTSDMASATESIIAGGALGGVTGDLASATESIIAGGLAGGVIM
jgi:hypothetical protein